MENSNSKHTKCPACSGLPSGKYLTIKSRIFLVCSTCQTLWSTEGPNFSDYNRNYIARRGHDQILSSINDAKTRSFAGFWRKLGAIDGPILEIGCSTGAGLRVALDMGFDVYGLDVNDSILPFVRKLGISTDKISTNGLGKFAGMKFKAVAFFDSFEHLPDPNIFLSELIPLLAEKCLILIVCPNGGSISRILLGTYWPHYVEDHWVHYTLHGLKTLLGKYHCIIHTTFYPVKYVSAEMIVRHAMVNWHIPHILLNKAKLSRSWTMKFNIGETGAIFKYFGATKT